MIREGIVIPEWLQFKLDKRFIPPKTANETSSIAEPLRQRRIELVHELCELILEQSLHFDSTEAAAGNVQTEYN